MGTFILPGCVRWREETGSLALSRVYAYMGFLGEALKWSVSGSPPEHIATKLNGYYQDQDQIPIAAGTVPFSPNLN